MFNFFSSSSKKGRYPNPNRGGSHYQKGGFFKISAAFPAPEADAAVMIRITSPMPIRLTGRDILSRPDPRVLLRYAQTAAPKYLPVPNSASPAELK